MRRIRRRHPYGLELYYVLSIVAFACVGLFALWGPGGYFQLRKATAERDRHRARVQELIRENQERKDRIRRLTEEDPVTIEEQARRNGFARQGEVIQQLPQQPARK